MTKSISYISLCQPFALCSNVRISQGRETDISEVLFNPGESLVHQTKWSIAARGSGTQNTGVSFTTVATLIGIRAREVEWVRMNIYKMLTLNHVILSLAKHSKTTYQ